MPREIGNILLAVTIVMLAVSTYFSYERSKSNFALAAAITHGTEMLAATRK